jgi:hypothetical protein
MQLSADEAQRISGNDAQESRRHLSKYQPSIFSKEARRDFVGEALLFAIMIVMGSAIAQHGICPQRILPRIAPL